MKKLLSMLGALTLVGGGGVSVVACSNNSKIIQSIKDKIKNTNIALPAEVNVDTSNAATITALKTALQNTNKLLTKADLADITFAKTNLKANEQKNNLTANIKAGSDTTTVSLNVIIHSTAKQINSKITNKAALIAIQAGSDAKLSDQTTQKAIKTSMQKAFKTLSDYDLTTITFDDAATKTLSDNQVVNDINITITDDSPSATKVKASLTNVKINSTAGEIAAKFTDKAALISLKAGSDQKLSNKTTADSLKTLIKTQYSLTDYDMANISFANTSQTLTDNETANSVKLNITDDNTPQGDDTVTLTNVQIHSTAAQIQKKITDVGRLYVTFVEATDATMSAANQTKIRTEFDANNPDLTTWDKKQLSLAFATGVTSFTAATRVDVTLTITDDETPTPGSVTVTLEVARFVSTTGATEDKYKAFKIADKIGASLITAIVTGSNVNVTNSITTTALRASLEAVNTVTSLTTADVAKITFSGSNLTTGEADNTVTATITESAGNTDTVTLTKVRINRTAAQIKAIVDAITKDVIVPGSGGTTGTTLGLDQLIRDQVGIEAPTLSPYDLSTIAVQGGIVIDTTAKAVTLSFQDGALGYATSNIQVKSAK